MAINAILGHPQADSLVTTAAIDAYALHHRHGAAWTGQSTANKETLACTASRHIASCPLAGPPLLTSLRTTWLQGLPAPTSDHVHQFGRADAGTTGTLVDAALQNYPDDLFAGGSVFIIAGTGEGQWAGVASFTQASGTLTLASTLTVAPDESSQYLLLWPLPSLVLAAVGEQALYLAGGVNLGALDQAGMGVAAQGDGGATLRPPKAAGHLCHQARALLLRAGLLNLDQSPAVGRG